MNWTEPCTCRQLEQTTRGSSICIELECLQQETGQLDGPEIGIKSYRLPSLLTVTVTVTVNLLSENRQTKIYLVLTCAMERVDMQTGQEESAHIPFVSKTEVILDATDINEIYSNAISRIPETMANFQIRGSNWKFMAVVKLDVNCYVSPTPITFCYLSSVFV